MFLVSFDHGHAAIVHYLLVHNLSQRSTSPKEVYALAYGDCWARTILISASLILNHLPPW